MNYDYFVVFFREFSTLFIELISAIIGSIFFHKYKHTILKYFLIYLWFIVFIEYSAFISREYFGVKYNAWLFNFFYVVHFLYLFYTYSLVLNNKKRKKIISYFAIGYSIVFIINGFFENYITRSQTIPFILGSGFLIISIIFYFTEVLKSEKVLSVKKNLLFWISVGLLLCYAGFIPFRITMNYYADMQNINHLYLILYALIIISNTCFIIGFIWSDRKQLY